MAGPLPMAVRSAYLQSRGKPQVGGVAIQGTRSLSLSMALFLALPIHRLGTTGLAVPPSSFPSETQPMALPRFHPRFGIAGHLVMDITRWGADESDDHLCWLTGLDQRHQSLACQACGGAVCLSAGVVARSAVVGGCGWTGHHRLLRLP